MYFEVWELLIDTTNKMGNVDNTEKEHRLQSHINPDLYPILIAISCVIL